MLLHAGIPIHVWIFFCFVAASFAKDEMKTIRKKDALYKNCDANEKKLKGEIPTPSPTLKGSKSLNERLLIIQDTAEEYGPFGDLPRASKLFTLETKNTKQNQPPYSYMGQMAFKL